MQENNNIIDSSYAQTSSLNELLKDQLRYLQLVKKEHKKIVAGEG